MGIAGTQDLRESLSLREATLRIYVKVAVMTSGILLVRELAPWEGKDAVCQRRGFEARRFAQHTHDTGHGGT